MDQRGLDKLCERVTAALLVAALGVVAWTFADYGISWDEPIHALQGQHTLDYLASGGTARAVFDAEYMYLYGSMFDAVARALIEVSPFSPFDTRHLFTALVGWLGVFGAGRVARTLGGSRAELATVAMLLLTPSWWGHAFINPKDLPLAVGGIWTLLALTHFGNRLPAPPLKAFVGVGVALGLTLAMRVGGVLFAVFALALLAACRPPLRVWVGSLVSVAIAYALMVAMWPYALENPIDGPLMALLKSAEFAFHKPLPVLLLGAVEDGRALPWFYWPVYLAVKLPELLLAFGLGGVALAAVRAWRGWRVGDGAAWFGYGGLVLTIVFPLTYAMVAGSIHYDAIRHFLFMVPALAVLAGLALARLAKTRRWPWAVLVVGLGVTASDMVRLHPYEYVYYNRMSGGLEGAEGRFELDYWATGYRQAIEDLIAIRPAPLTINVCGPASSAYYFLEPGYSLVERDGDVVLRMAGRACDAPRGQEIVRVERFGVPLVTVEEIRP